MAFEMASHSRRNVCNPSESGPVLTIYTDVGGASARALTAGTRTKARVNKQPARLETNRDKDFIVHTDAESVSGHIAGISSSQPARRRNGDGPTSTKLFDGFQLEFFQHLIWKEKGYCPAAFLKSVSSTFGLISKDSRVMVMNSSPSMRRACLWGKSKAPSFR